MRIGLIAPPWIPVPPPAYGGTELVVDNLARGLKALGHEVELFTVGDSTSPVNRRHLYATAAEPMGAAVPEAAHVLAAYEAFADVDIIHDHTVLGPLLTAGRGRRRPPVVITQHGTFTPQTRRIFTEIARYAAIVAISESHARSAGGAPIAAVIHHGVDLDLYQPGAGAGGYLLFMGRVCSDKGVHRAVRIAKRAGRPLVLATKIRLASEQAYFDREVRPLLDLNDVLLPEQSFPRKAELLRDAVALVNPIVWPEPFGLVMVEALASATPVLAFGNGAAPEIVDHGATGYLCENDDEMVEAIWRIDRIDRGACRAAAEARFSLERMARDHERLYRRVLAASDRRFASSGQAVAHGVAAV